MKIQRDSADLCSPVQGGAGPSKKECTLKKLGNNKEQQRKPDNHQGHLHAVSNSDSIASILFTTKASLFFVHKTSTLCKTK